LRRHHGFGTLAGAFFADLAKELNREYELVASGVTAIATAK
jgi:hypothetical protein